MDPVPITVALPLPKDVVNRASRWKILGKIAPLAPRAQQVKQPVQRLAHVCRARSSALPRRRDQWRDLCPFGIAQVRRITTATPNTPLALCFCPHGHTISTPVQAENHNRLIQFNTFRDRLSDRCGAQQIVGPISGFPDFPL